MSDSWPELNDQVRDIWNANATFWDGRMGEGNDFFHTLVAPAMERLLKPVAGEKVLDIACGNGNYCRWLADRGLTVVGVDLSEVFIKRARQRSAGYGDCVRYEVVDANDAEALLAIEGAPFNAITCNMALMDMAEIDPMLQTLPQLLKPQGRFVFSICHPCFNTTGMAKVVEEVDDQGEIKTQYAVKIFRYKTPTSGKGLGMIGQPRPQYYFDRPMEVLFGACFKAGWVVDGLEEPSFPADSDPTRALSWGNFAEIPPVLAVRLCRLAST